MKSIGLAFSTAFGARVRWRWLQGDRIKYETSSVGAIARLVILAGDKVYSLPTAEFLFERHYAKDEQTDRRIAASETDHDHARS
jgi:hypothetical protein